MKDKVLHKKKAASPKSPITRPSKTIQPGQDSVAWALLDAKAEAVLLVKLNGSIRFANQTAVKRFGKSKEELMGLYAWDLYPSTQTNYIKILFSQMVRTGEPITFKVHEENGWSQTMVHPVHNKSGRVGMIALCTWDATPLVEAQERYKRTALELISAQEGERRRISQDLHDDIGQRMTGLALNLRSIESALEGGHPISVDEVKNAIHELEAITKQTRQIFYQLNPPSLGKVGFSKVLAAFCASFEESTRIVADFNCQEDLPELSDLQTMTLYRFVQEGLANVAKHALASHAWISLDFSDGDLNISLEDDGKGFDSRNMREGMGLHGIRERFQALHGSVEIESSQGNGTHLFGSLPYKPEDI